jgi:hypothetical protein
LYRYTPESLQPGQALVMLVYNPLAAARSEHVRLPVSAAAAVAAAAAGAAVAAGAAAAGAAGLAAGGVGLYKLNPFVRPIA